MFRATRPAPDLMGLSLTAARAAAHRAHLGLERDGVIVDPGAPNASVVLADPESDGHQVDVVIAVHFAPRCAFGQLAIQYRPGAAGMGNDFGAIELRNVSPDWCELAGPLQVTGLDSSGRAITNTVSNSVARRLELSPGAAPIPPHTNPPADQLIGQVLLSAEYRDDSKPPYGICVDRVVPSGWRVDLKAGTLTVPNGRANADAVPIGSGGLVTCRGHFDAARVDHV